MFHEMTIAGCKRQLPLCPINEELYIGAFIMFNDVEITEASAKELLAKAPEFDVIVTPEAKSIPLAYEMSRQSGKPYIVARKGAKLYMRNVIETDVNSITTDHVQHLCIGEDEAGVIKGKRLLLVDDVVSTGESVDSLELLVSQVPDVTIAGKACVLAEGDAIARGDIIYLEKLPLFNADGSIKE